MKHDTAHTYPTARKKIKAFIHLLSLGALVNCAQAQASDCFPKASRNKNPNAAERKALEDSRHRLTETCQKANAQCDFQVKTRDGEITVSVQVAEVSKPGECFHRLGVSTFRYSRHGKYIGFAPAL